MSMEIYRQVESVHIILESEVLPWNCEDCHIDSNCKLIQWLQTKKNSKKYVASIKTSLIFDELEKCE